MIEHDITFVTEKTFRGCANKHKLRFDFFLPSYKLLIEFQGIQHFKPHNFGSTSTKEKRMNNLLDLQKRDAIKQEWISTSPYTLLLINYDEVDNISDILKNTLSL